MTKGRKDQSLIAKIEDCFKEVTHRLSLLLLRDKEWGLLCSKPGLVSKPFL